MQENNQQQDGVTVKRSKKKECFIPLILHQFACEYCYGLFKSDTSGYKPFSHQPVFFFTPSLTFCLSLKKKNRLKKKFKNAVWMSFETSQKSLWTVQSMHFVLKLRLKDWIWQLPLHLYYIRVLK